MSCSTSVLSFGCVFVSNKPFLGPMRRRYSRVLEWLLDEALRQIEREGLEPVAPLDGDKFLHEIEVCSTHLVF